MSLPPLVAVLVFAAECLALGWLTAVDWPSAALPVARWALRFLVGLSLLGSALLLQAFTPLSLSTPWIGLAFAAVLALLVRLLHRDRVTGSPPTIDRTELLGWLLLSAVLAGAVVRAWIVPEAGWDAYSHWGFKAQAYFLAGHFIPTNTAHEYYPPLVPLAEMHLFALLGNSNIDLAKVIWALAGSAFVFSLAWHLRLALPRPSRAPYYALGILLGTELLLESFWTGQADLALTAFLCLGTLALFRVQRCANRASAPWLAQAAIFFLAASLTKYEGAFRVAFILGVFALESLWARAPARRWLSTCIVCALAAGAGVLVWAIFEAVFHVTASSEHLVAPDFEAIPAIARALVKAFAGIRSGGSLLVVAVGLALFARTAVRPPYRFLTLVVAVQFLATLASFLTSATDPALEVLDAANRLFLQWLPLAFVVIALALESSSLPRPAAPRMQRDEMLVGPRNTETAPV